MRLAVDVSEIFQSLIKDFIRRANQGVSAPANQVDMVRYLATSAENKIRARWRKERRQLEAFSDRPRRDFGISVEQVVAENDLVDSLRARLDGETRTLLDLRLQGLTWREIAAIYGGHPDALRMQLRRSVAVSHLRDKRDASLQ